MWRGVNDSTCTYVTYNSAWHIVSVPYVLSVLTVIPLSGQESRKLRGMLRERKMRRNGRGIQEEQGGRARWQGDFRVVTTQEGKTLFIVGLQVIQGAQEEWD